MSVIFLSGPIGAGKTAVAQELVRLLPAPLSCTSRQKGAIAEYARLKNFYALFEEDGIEPICDDHAGHVPRLSESLRG